MLCDSADMQGFQEAIFVTVTMATNGIMLHTKSFLWIKKKRQYWLYLAKHNVQCYNIQYIYIFTNTSQLLEPRHKKEYALVYLQKHAHIRKTF